MIVIKALACYVGLLAILIITVRLFMSFITSRCGRKDLKLAVLDCIPDHESAIYNALWEAAEKLVGHDISRRDFDTICEMLQEAGAITISPSEWHTEPEYFSRTPTSVAWRAQHIENLRREAWPFIMHDMAILSPPEEEGS